MTSHTNKSLLKVRWINFDSIRGLNYKFDPILLYYHVSKIKQYGCLLHLTAHLFRILCFQNQLRLKVIYWWSHILLFIQFIVRKVSNFKFYQEEIWTGFATLINYHALENMKKCIQYILYQNRPSVIDKDSIIDQQERDCFGTLGEFERGFRIYTTWFLSP
jgi:hypothetical protein